MLSFAALESSVHTGWLALVVPTEICTHPAKLITTSNRRETIAKWELRNLQNKCF